MALLIFYLTLALFVSFLCSIVEAVILSVSAPFIRMQEMQGKRAAHYLKNLKNNIDRPLSAILTINTVAHTIGAAGVGAQAVAVFGEAYFGVISAVLTLLILFFSEIIPKTIGAVFWRKLALPSAMIIKVMIFLSYPLVLIAELLTKMIAKNKKLPSVSREEVEALIHLGTKEGVLKESESKIIHNLIRLRTVYIKAIMTPRTVMVAAPEELQLNEYIKNKTFLQYSRIPVYSKTIDQVTGYILNSDVLEKLAEGKVKIELKDLKRPISTFYENASILKLFEELLLKREHIALVIDEYGSTQGLVTMEDIIETILGLEIMDEKDIEVDMQELARKKWEIRKKRLKIERMDMGPNAT
ncbi:MAG: CNNM domain-containing protein [candidate division KSB1 bacterium]|nr:CNNM domain-containing protein [candidate division KSB1 bacterium]